MQTTIVDVDGPIHLETVAAAAGAQDSPTLVLLHGLGGSTVGWRTIQEELGEQGRVVAFDLPGHGRSPRAGRSTTIGANTALIHRVLDEHVPGPKVLVGNSMGGLLALHVAPRRDVVGMILVNPAVPGPFEIPRPDVLLRFLIGMLPGIAPTLVRRRREKVGIEESIRQTLRFIAVDPASIDARMITEGAANLRDRGPDFDGDAAFVEATRSTVATAANRKLVDGLARAVTVPTLLLHGHHDRLVSVAAARRLHDLQPSWTLEIHPDVGHVPQLEDPAWTLSTIRRWWPAIEPACSTGVRR